MARNKEFDKEKALDAAISVFREHGFEGTSTDMLVRAMGIGRQSLYDTYGDKWKLYCHAVERYSDMETHAHIAALRTGPNAIDGLRAMIDRVVAEAGTACLGVGSICEFGQTRQELSALRYAAERRLTIAVETRIREAQTAGDLDTALAASDMASFILANIAGIRIAARGGARPEQLDTLGAMVMRAMA